MVLQRQVIDLPFGGLDTKTAKQLVKPGSTLTLQDCEFDKLGAINKRSGFTALGTTAVQGGSAVAAGVGAAKGPAGELLVSDGSRLLTWSSASQAWASLGEYYPGGLRTLNNGTGTGFVTTGQASSCDVAVIGNYAMAVSRVNGSVSAAMVDMSSNTVVWTGFDALDNTGSRIYSPRVVAIGTYFLILYVQYNSPTHIKYVSINTAVPSGWTTSMTAAVSALVTDFDNLSNFDAVTWSVNSTCLLAYRAAGNTMKVCKFNQTGVTATSTPTPDNTDVQGSMGIILGATNFVVAYECNFSGTLLHAYMLDATLAVVYQNRALLSTGANTSSTWVGYETSANVFKLWSTGIVTSSYTSPAYSMTTSSLGAESTYLIPGGFYIASRPFTYTGAGSKSFPAVWLLYTRQTSTGAAPDQSTYFLFNIASQNVVGVYARQNGMPDSALYNSTKYLAPCSVVVVTGGFLVGLPTSGPVAGAGSTQLVVMDTTYPVRSASINGTTVLTGMMLYETDGVSVKEAGYLLYPELTLSGTTGGSLTPSATYYVLAVWRDADAMGRVTYSATSLPTAVTLGGAQNAITAGVTAYPFQRGKWSTNTRYTTDIFISADAVNYYLAGPCPGGSAITLTSLSTAARQPYTSGSVLENGSPPALCDVIRRGDRLYGATPDGVVYYTKEVIEGETPAWSPDFAVRSLNHDGGSYYQLADIDGRLTAFGENSMQWMSGSGVNDTGSSDDLSSPQLVPTEGGIVRGSPVLATDEGIWIKQPQGINVLTRSLSVEEIGLPVYTYRTLTTVSAVNVQHKNQVRFGHSDGVTLVYDLVAKQWSTFTNHLHVGALYLGGSYYLLRSDGIVWRNDAAVWTDAGTAIGRVVELPWLHLGALQGVQRLYWLDVLGEWASSISLQLQLFYDFSQTGDTAVTYAKTTGSAGDPIAFRHHSGKRCAVVKPVLTDTSAGQGASLTGLSLELGVRGQVSRLTQGQTV